LGSKIREEVGLVHALVEVYEEALVELMMCILVPGAVAARRNQLSHPPEKYVAEDLSEMILKIQEVPQVFP
jgi:hypothetical protein